ncbi:MAG: hypothetical protein IJL94_02510, partial [Erysipelotrichaceae bacterium]|nr:hypothetical protein [Erysipelotrichaceae bacterium]
ATTTVASLVVNNSFDAVSDVINTDHQEDNIREFEEHRELTLKEKISSALSSAPLVFRILVLVPLWFIGYGLMFLINPLISALSGVISDIGCWLLLSGLVLLIILIGGYFIFPGSKLKDRFNSKTVIWTLVSVGTIILLDKAAGAYSEEYRRYSSLSRYIASMTLTIGWAVIMAVKFMKKHPKVMTVSSDKYTFTEVSKGE